MWQGIVHYRCRETKYPENGDWKLSPKSQLVCGSDKQCDVACGSLFELELLSPNGTKSPVPTLSLAVTENESSNEVKTKIIDLFI